MHLIYLILKYSSYNISQEKSLVVKNLMYVPLVSSKPKVFSVISIKFIEHIFRFFFSNFWHILERRGDRIWLLLDCVSCLKIFKKCIYLNLQKFTATHHKTCNSVRKFTIDLTNGPVRPLKQILLLKKCPLEPFEQLFWHFQKFWLISKMVRWEWISGRSSIQKLEITRYKDIQTTPVFQFLKTHL